MNCEKISRMMQTALDQGRAMDTGREERLPEAVREHLRACPRCRRAWEEARAVEDGLGELARADAVEPPAALHRKIMTAVRQEQRRLAAAKTARRYWPARPALATAAALLVGLGFCWLALPRHTPPPSPGPAFSTAGIWPPTETLDPSASTLAGLFEAPKQDIKELAGSILATATPLLGVVESIQQQDDVKEKLSASRDRAD